MKSRFQTLTAELQQKSHYAKSDYEWIAAQLGDEYLCDRLELQLKLYRGQEKPVRMYMRKLFRAAVVSGLYCIGQLERSRRCARSPEWVEQTWAFDNLPDAFEGYRILQLTDFHFDFIPELPEIVNTLVSQHAFDCCVLTGDFRGETTGPYEESLTDLKRTRKFLGDQVFAVLGNHDNIELMFRLPELGIRLLMNEAVPLERQGQTIQLAGIDDPHFYKTPELGFLTSPSEAFTILLSHSPESWRASEASGVDLQFSGHTHGGQICLPGGIPVVAHLEDCSRSMIKGRWQSGALQGYTSRGVGSSSLDLRFNCPPEITLHTLRCR